MGESMSRLRSIATMWLMTALFQLASLGQTAAPFTLSIKSSPSTVKAGTEIKLEITVANVSDRPISVYQVSGEAEAVNKIEVRDTSGSVLPRIDGRTMMISGKPHYLPKQWLSRKGVVLKPGETLEDFSILSKMFDLTKPGKYAIVAKHWIRKGESEPIPGWIGATSNTIYITVAG
jgi:hypothetical protein